MGVPREVVTAPCQGDYLTDGRRLVEVMGVDRDGRYECEDCGVNPGILHIPAEQLSKWRVVVAAV